MIDENRCPMCGTPYKVGKDNCSWQITERGHLHRCAHYKIACVVDGSVGETYGYNDNCESYRRFNAIVAFLLHNPYSNDHRRYWRFFHEESTIGKPVPLPKSPDSPISHNIANEMVDYPRNFQQQIDRVLLALSARYPMMGYRISVDGHDRAIYYVANHDPVENGQEIRGMLDRLTELGYLKAHADNNYEISAPGWIHISELSRIENEVNQGFIAMAFNKDTKEIGEAFHDAIYECGYLPRRIDQKEHNNQIVPEIFFEIKRSKFLVVDVTYPNHGAYYEAGYGEALNKQVIVCCRKDEFDGKNKPHFDIAQKSTVVWANIDELKEKLKTRIEATVGLNQKRHDVYAIL